MVVSRIRDSPGVSRTGRRKVGRVIRSLSRSERQLVPGHWFGSAVALAVGLALAWTVVGFGHGAPLALTVIAAAAAVAVWNSPLRVSGHVPLQSVRSVAGVEHVVVVLWRPGCPYSSALRRRVAREGLRVHWVNIWRDRDAYTLCRSINNGAEETPTAMVLDPTLSGPVVIPASLPGILEATAAALPRGRADREGWLPVTGSDRTPRRRRS